MDLHCPGVLLCCDINSGSWFDMRSSCMQGQLFFQVVKSEGPKTLYVGLTPALTRSILYGGLRLGLYEPSKYVCDWAFGSSNLLVKIASGAFAGAFATALTNPVEVIKVIWHYLRLNYYCLLLSCNKNYFSRILIFLLYRLDCRWIQVLEREGQLVRCVK